MRLSRMFGGLAVCLSVIGPAGAHGGFSMPPARIQTGHALGHQTNRSFKASVVINGSVDSSALYAGGEGVSEMTVFSVPSEAQRYMNATGRALPESHSNIRLPPATPKGDYTYIWENNGPE